MSKVFFQLTCVLLMIVGDLSAAVIGGKVTDREGEPIEGVNVQTDLSSLFAVTGEDGSFSLETGKQLPSYLSFSHVSYQPRMIRVEGAEVLTGLEIVLDLAVYPGQRITVTAMRAQTGLTPVAFSDFTDEDVERDYLVSDFPLLLETTPNLYSYGIDGGGLNASDFKIRGFDSRRISVYINGVPLNDPEDHTTYFYDIPDFAAEVTDIQVQRGIGNSLYGDASFGGSINIASAGLNRNRKITLTAGYGKYYGENRTVSEIRKQSVEYSSGLLNGRWSLAGRYSKQYSGGYRERSWYDGWSYFFSVSRLDPRMATTINVYGGPIKAHMAWDGISREVQRFNRRTNPSKYSNETDNFNQPHYTLHNVYRVRENVTLDNTLYYIRGKGYYEQLKSNRKYAEYNIPIEATSDSTTRGDLVRQKWVTKHQIGWNPRLDWNRDRGLTSTGGSFYYFDSDHWGQVVWAENLTSAIKPGHRYYEYFGKKYHASIYFHEYYHLTKRWRLMGNVQLKYLHYGFDQCVIGAFTGYRYDLDWLFVSPRIGVTYLVNNNTDLFINFAVSSREPDDATIYDADDPDVVPAVVDGELTAESERVFDFEIGGNLTGRKLIAGLNLFWMEFRNEIIPEGGIDDDGRPILGNADRSVRSGIEASASFSPNSYVTISGNGAYNYNRLRDYLLFKDTDWDGVVDDTADYSDNPTAGFPEYLANLIFDLHNMPYARFVFRLRMVGRQFIENGDNRELSIDPYMVSSISASFMLAQPQGLGKLYLLARFNNIFNEKFESAGYAYEWGGVWYGEYYTAAERNMFLQLKWEFD
jgi:iron complex outermembrane receptor protein